jgi:hypothetical protein
MACLRPGRRSRATELNPASATSAALGFAMITRSTGGSSIPCLRKISFTSRRTRFLITAGPTRRLTVQPSLAAFTLGFLAMMIVNAPV